MNIKTDRLRIRQFILSDFEDFLALIIVWILILGIINTGFGCYLYFSSLSKLPFQTVEICGYLEPLSAVIFAALLLSEKMSLLQIAGAVCILGGAMAGEFIKAKKHMK